MLFGLLARSSLAQVSTKFLRNISTSRASRFAETAVAKTDSAPKVAEPVKKQGATVSQRFGAFVLGTALSLGLGFYQLQNDIEKATANIDESLRALRRDTVEAQKSIRQRIADLEGR
uniref:Uncharacterized protein n=1 Tax=Aplanochytrium stocchinoi TaxID=215587 RepID=A0A7S3PGV6_9STRA|mmetsp:Transcript_370/g.421  ORF Transcript_370/g.421 Transcript_370/m.421 type:complete len:117 (+) Transcript_370:241-591(+)